MGHVPFRQRVTDEHGVDGLQIELSAQIHDGEILVIELAMLLRGVAVALDQVLEQLAMRLQVAVQVHAHEAMQLQEAGIDIAHEAWIGERHLGDDVAAEPLEAAALGKRIHGSRLHARINWAAHQHHGMRHIGVVVRLHARNRREHRY